jgi:hypothetical protein
MQFGQQQGSDMEFGAPQKPGTAGEGALAPSASSSGNMYSNRDQTIAKVFLRAEEIVFGYKERVC